MKTENSLQSKNLFKLQKIFANREEYFVTCCVSRLCCTLPRFECECVFLPVLLWLGWKVILSPLVRDVNVEVNVCRLFLRTIVLSEKFDLANRLYRQDNAHHAFMGCQLRVGAEKVGLVVL